MEATIWRVVAPHTTKRVRTSSIHILVPGTVTTTTLCGRSAQGWDNLNAEPHIATCGTCKKAYEARKGEGA